MREPRPESGTAPANSEGSHAHSQPARGPRISDEGVCAGVKMGHVSRRSAMGGNMLHAVVVAAVAGAAAAAVIAVFKRRQMREEMEEFRPGWADLPQSRPGVQEPVGS